MTRRRRRRRRFFPGDGRERRRAANAVRRLRKPTVEEIAEVVSRFFADALVPVFVGMRQTAEVVARIGSAIKALEDALPKAIKVAEAEFVSVRFTVDPAAAGPRTPPRNDTGSRT